MPQHFCKVLHLILLVRSPVGPLLEVWRMRDLPDPGTISVHRVQILLAQMLNVATEQDLVPIRRPTGRERHVAPRSCVIGRSPSPSGRMRKSPRLNRLVVMASDRKMISFPCGDHPA